MVTKDEALKMAIERLEVFQMGFGGLTDVIQACKEALSQPSMTYEQGFAHGYEAYKAENTAQEPVAYTDKYRNFLEWDIKDLCDKAVCKKHEAIPLYSAQPQKQWVGLSDDDFKDTSWFTDEFIEGANWAQNKLKGLNT